MGVEAQIKLAVDRIAKGRQASQAVWTGTVFWDLADAAADQTYENAIKGSDLTAMDAALTAGAVFGAPTLARWFALHSQYFQSLGLASPYFESYLAQYGWQVGYEFAKAHYEALGYKLSGQYVFAKGTRPASGTVASAGMHKFAVFTPNSTFTRGFDGALDSAFIKGAPIVAVNQSATQSVGGGSFTCLCQDGVTTKACAFVLSSAAQWTYTILGEQSLGAVRSVGDTSLTVTNTYLTAGDYIVISEGTKIDVVKVATLVSTTGVTLSTGLKNAYTTAAKVWPLFLDVTAGSATSGSGDVHLHAYPTRIIAL